MKLEKGRGLKLVKVGNGNRIKPADVERMDLKQRFKEKAITLFVQKNHSE